MEFLIGAVLAAVVGLSLTVLGMDRERALYPAIMMFIAMLYVLFAVMGGTTNGLFVVTPIAAVFIALAAIGYKKSLWFVVFALAGHGAFDLVQGNFISGAGVPSFWPMFCSAYDFVAAAYLALLLIRDRVSATVVSRTI